jgi:outer membrane protein assembly factor BamD
MTRRLDFVRSLGLIVAAICLVTAQSCGPSKAKLPAPGSSEADKYLFDHGTEALGKKRWLVAREYFKRLVDTYPQSQYRQDAKLAIGDTYLGENSVESNILAANEFHEFLTYFPLNPRADYAQYKIGLAHFNQMLAPERDQTATQQAITEFDTFLRNYPTSRYRPDVEKLRQRAKDRLSESQYKVGLFYYRIKNYVGAVNRFKDLLAGNPQYPGRDAVYFYLAETLHKVKIDAEALPYYDRIVTEFERSDYLQRAKKRITELKH